MLTTKARIVEACGDPSLQEQHANHRLVIENDLHLWSLVVNDFCQCFEKV